MWFFTQGKLSDFKSSSSSMLLLSTPPVVEAAAPALKHSCRGPSGDPDESLLFPFADSSVLSWEDDDGQKPPKTNCDWFAVWYLRVWSLYFCKESQRFIDQLILKIGSLLPKWEKQTTHLQMALHFIVRQTIHLHQFPDLLWSSSCRDLNHVKWPPNCTFFSL